MEIPVYLDNHATTKLDPRVLDAMRPFLADEFGNASSRTHKFGWEADKAVDTARRQVAALLGADPREIVFTSGATESNNLALKGVVEAYADKGDHIISAVTEHPAVVDTLVYLEGRGVQVTWLPLDETGRVSAEDVAAAINDRTILITLMAANNEIGTLHPIAEIGRLAEERGVFFHSDATQAVGKIPFGVNESHVHLVSITGHKMNGPKGCGALYVRRRDPEVRLANQIHGGGQERGMRPGTLNVPSIVGLGKTAEIALAEQPEEETRVRALRDHLQGRLFDELDGVTLNGHPEQRVPGNLNVSFLGTDSEALIMAMPQIAISSGSACASGSIEPSKILSAIGVPPQRARASIRFGVGRFNTREEVDFASERVVEAVKRLRGAGLKKR
ncbi:MAG: aminotransferase class V-fold PLP-dependent enzyme [Planctomycetota bacterium]|nr:aminotransferase class V-fold PLP-dependent enzyme [Planctomycetota bacterium]